MSFERPGDKIENKSEFPGISEAMLVKESDLLSDLNLPELDPIFDKYTSKESYDRRVKSRAIDFGLTADSSAADIHNWAKDKLKIFLGLPKNASSEDFVYAASERKANLLNLPLDANDEEVKKAIAERSEERDEVDSQYIIGEEAGIRASLKINSFISWYLRHLSRKSLPLIVTYSMRKRAIELGLPKESSDQDVRDFLKSAGLEALAAVEEGKKTLEAKDAEDILNSITKVEVIRRYELSEDATWEEILKAIADDIFFSNGSKIRDNWSDDEFMKEIIQAMETQESINPKNGDSQN